MCFLKLLFAIDLQTRFNATDLITPKEIKVKIQLQSDLRGRKLSTMHLLLIRVGTNVNGDHNQIYCHIYLLNALFSTPVSKLSSDSSSLDDSSDLITW